MNRTCFVEMPFDHRFDGIWNTVIRPVVEKCGDKCIRADDFFVPGSILQDIFKSIHSADYVVAELTLHNANVYYELGYTHALTKPAILITQDLQSLPFDLRHQRVIVYEDTAAGAAKLAQQLEQYINNI